METPHSTPNGETKRKYPKSIRYIFWNETAERYSFYGMKAILTTFLATTLLANSNNPDAAASQSVHTFITLAYFFSIVGGLLSDWWLGKYKTILYLSIVYCIGHAVLAFGTENVDVFMGGLLLITIGAGGIKPCVSAFLGDQLQGYSDTSISKAYSIFYFCINIGAFLATLSIPILTQQFGYEIGFGVPGILMALATAAFLFGTRQYKHLPPTGWPKQTFLGISFYAFRTWIMSPRKGLWAAAKEKYPEKSIKSTRQVWKVIALFAFIPAYHGLYDQNGSEWVLQATRMDLNFMGVTWYAEQIQMINPILILVFIPLFAYVIYPALAKLGLNMNPVRKMQAGLFVSMSSFAIIYFLQVAIDGGATPSIAWQILAYVLLTASEVLVMMTGLEYAYTQAPESMKSTVTSIWLLTISLGNYFVSFINGKIESGGALSEWMGADGRINSNFYLFFIGILVVNTLLFVLVGRKWGKSKQAAPSD